MLSHLGDDSPKVKSEQSTSPQPSEGKLEKSADIGDIDENDIDGDDRCNESNSNQLVLYKPDTNNIGQEVDAMSDHIEDHTSSFQDFLVQGRVSPSVGTFAVQCAACFKWRFIPKKETYEEIRARILEEPFKCARAREWRPDITCDDPADLSQDGSRLWAIDKPNIAQPPPGWQRLLKFRGEGSTKFADVYYVAPSGKRMRSMNEVEKFLFEHPEYIREGVNLSLFSFQTPRPLQENYVRKRPARATSPYVGVDLEIATPLEPVEVNPLSWVSPPTCDDLQIGQPGLSSPCPEPPVYHPIVEPPPPAKRKKVRRPSSKQMYDSPVCNQP